MASKKLTAEQQALFDVLTPLQKRFVTHVLKGKNQTEAYKAAKGKAKGDALRAAASRMYANVNVQAVRNSASRMFTNIGVQAFLKSVQGEAINDAIMTPGPWRNSR